MLDKLLSCLRLGRQLVAVYGIRALAIRVVWIVHALLRGKQARAKLQAAHVATPSIPVPDSALMISIVTPVYNVPAAFWRETVQTVQQQTYPNWEWCVVDGGSMDTAWMDAWFPANDPRIRFKRLDRNNGISANTMQTISMATGDFVFFLDHDDLIDRHALAYIVTAIQQAPNTDIIYFDEDKYTDAGQYIEPFIKPPWSPHTLLSANYLTHAVYRKSLFDNGLSLDQAYDGAQDWALALQAMARGARVWHIPRILYHWRVHPASTALQSAVKPWTIKAQKRCLYDHLKPYDLHNLTIRIPAAGFYRICWLNDCVLYQVQVNHGSDRSATTVHRYTWKRGHPHTHKREKLMKQRDIGKQDLLTHLQSIIPANDPAAVCMLTTPQAARQLGVNQLRELAQWCLFPRTGLVIPRHLSHNNIATMEYRSRNDDTCKPLFAKTPLHGFFIHGSPDWYHNPDIVPHAAVLCRVNAVSHVMPAYLDCLPQKISRLSVEIPHCYTLYVPFGKVSLD